MIPTVDSHAHVFSKYYKDDLSVIIEECANNLSYVVNVACDKQMIDECTKQIYPSNFYFLFGFHPHDAKSIDSADLLWLKEKLVKTKKIIGLGEIGLDYFKEYSPVKDQLKLFKDQISIADKIGLPVVIHCRDAHPDTVEILKEARNNGFKPNILLHCFSGTVLDVEKYIELDTYFSFAGPVTFKNNRNADQVIKKVPLNRLLIETDCPYLSPVPFRGKTNKPAHVYYVLKKISEILEIEEEKLNEIIEDNLKSMFPRIKKE